MKKRTLLEILAAGLMTASCATHRDADIPAAYSSRLFSKFLRNNVWYGVVLIRGDSYDPNLPKIGVEITEIISSEYFTALVPLDSIPRLCERVESVSILPPIYPCEEPE